MFEERGARGAASAVAPLDDAALDEARLDALLLAADDVEGEPDDLPDPVDPEDPQEWARWVAYRAACAPEQDEPGPADEPEAPSVPATDRLEALTASPMGPQVLASLVALEAEGLTPHEEVTALALYERARSWLTARSTRALLAIVPDPAPERRDGRLTKDELDRQVEHESARFEAAAALRLTTGQMRYRVAEAHALRGHPRVLDRMETGAITPAHARTLVEGLSELDGDPQAQAVVEGQALDKAATSTVRATRDTLRRLVLAADPAAAERRHEQARRERTVGLTPLPDGMAELYARVDAADARAAFACLAAAADHSRPSDDCRTADQRRADTLVELLCRAGEDAPPTSRRRQRAQVGVVVAATTIAGRDELPAHLDGYGPITAEQARRITADGELHRLLVDPVSGRLLDRGRTTYRPPEDLKEHVRARDRHCSAPGCSTDAAATEVDHDTKWDDLGPTDRVNLRCQCGCHHRAKDHGGWSTRAGPDGSTTWTSPRGHTYTVDPATYAEFLPPADASPRAPDPDDPPDPPGRDDDPDDDDVPF